MQGTKEQERASEREREGREIAEESASGEYHIQKRPREEHEKMYAEYKKKREVRAHQEKSR